MNRKLYLDVTAVLLAWCLFLNGYEKTGALLLLLAAVLLAFTGVIKDLWRFLALTLLSGILFGLFLSAGTIAVFFPHVSFFLHALSVHVGLLNEMVKDVSKETMRPFFAGTVILMVLFYGIAWILPSDWYSLFTKANLYDLISFIFLPLLTPMLLKEIESEVLPSLGRFLGGLSE